MLAYDDVRKKMSRLIQNVFLIFLKFLSYLACVSSFRSVAVLYPKK